MYNSFPILYMFRAPLCSSSGESFVLIRHLVYVSHVGDRLVCRFPSKPAHQTVTYIECHIPDIVFIQFILLMISTVVLEICTELE